jgi:sorbitol-specific phosphotransferase system component IIBC
MTYKTVKVEKGRGGWGIPLLITPVPGKDKISSITGGGIHPVAQKIAELSGGTAIDGFRHPVADGEVACAVIDCGGTCRLGILPSKNILTININGGGPSGPFAKFIKEGLYVSGVRVENVSLEEKQTGGEK